MGVLETLAKQRVVGMVSCLQISSITKRVHTRESSTGAHKGDVILGIAPVLTLGVDQELLYSTKTPSARYSGTWCKKLTGPFFQLYINMYFDLHIRHVDGCGGAQDNFCPIMK